jgi:hypothetical protein
MKKNIREVMSRWIQPPKLAVEHVRHPSQRVPIRGIGMSESPDNALRSQPSPDMRVVGNVVSVVQAKKWVMADRGVNRDGHQGQTNANQEIRHGTPRLDGRGFLTKPGLLTIVHG